MISGHKTILASSRFLVEKFPATIEDRDNVSWSQSGTFLSWLIKNVIRRIREGN